MHSHSHFVKNLRYLIRRMCPRFGCCFGFGFFSRLTILEKYSEEENLTKAYEQRTERRMNIQLEECKK